ncbi:bifunctional hydroxymethylpyrimidine kinase/phosphomethylpyrimidine kinase [Piscinibacter sp.]|uniref:bifunctional hydroxymethylpyrimidine kinase/phosphomethylpyrimidine kinase n=1 Tax=Piscinibacter sp. TaxID=1903157 RepID=UPI002BCF1A68|nr:bifunctional hydroxymethylpyrimidine kinase/phosphomethylpyrimidine kinase [Albitalea sp.]HUG21696.1 bifunctional hydroxymethylpyrimidine kinase/phosphomethylpyrimidine kinase [Albitalea sp.]
MTRPIVWSIAGTDSGGGAGLAADQRAADAFGVHLCPVVAAVTAQNSQSVARVQAVGVELLEAQLAALESDMPPAAIKTGLLGDAAQIELVARWIDRLRERAPVALVVDPVLGASTGASFADDAALRAYRDRLLPRATLLTPNRREAGELLGASDDSVASQPALAQALRTQGAKAVCITGGDSAGDGGRALDWIATEHARGWLASPRVATAHNHGTGCTFASSAAAALALGFVAADALVLAKMATGHALRAGYAAGEGAGPVHAGNGFAGDASLLPQLSWGPEPCFAGRPASAAPPLELYAIVESADRVNAVLAAGVRTVQLRVKTPPDADAAWRVALRDAVRRSVEACRAAAGAQLFVNDHWRLALELGAPGVHLGQEDLLAMSDDERRGLAASGLALGISSHSLWELCRARSLAPRYVACGPVWPTLTKAMPWRPQGLHNLSWWCAMAGAPVVAIGGILSAAQVEDCARSGAAGVCAVRALGDDPRRSVPALQQAWERGRRSPPDAGRIGLPRPSLVP